MKVTFFVVLAFFLSFIGYPLFFLFWKSAGVSLDLFPIVWANIAVRESFANSFALACYVTLAATIIGLPLAAVTSFFRIPKSRLWRKLFLLPLVAPPFVAAIAMRQILARFGPFNLALLHLHIVKEPINFLGSGLAGIFILQTLHLYPIIWLNVSASLENLDYSAVEASTNLGASMFHTFRHIILPLVVPGYFAGAFLVFVWSLTDLGTPLVFDYPRLIPVVVFQSLTDIHTNPNGYILVLFITLFALMFFFIVRSIVRTRSFVNVARYHTEQEKHPLPPKIAPVVCIFMTILLAVSLLPHIAVILNSFAREWFFTIFPTKWGIQYYRAVFSHALAGKSLLNSLLYSSAAACFATVIGLATGFVLARSTLKWKNALETMVIVPMAVPGIVFAFAYLLAFSGTFLDPKVFPVFLLVTAYALRRLPFSVRAILANFQQMEISCEEAAINLGAGKWRIFLDIILPRLKNGMFAGLILSFAFSMMEVSASLILVSRERYFPAAKGIYQLAGRVTDGPYVASALGVLGMIVCFAALFSVSRFLERRESSFFL
jgi:iron(III) transport system permease protein